MFEQNPRGRPTKYEERMDNEARIIMQNLGATMLDLAAIFAVNESTVYEWQSVHPSFSKAIKEGREAYDNNLVERSLRDRAIGYSHPDTHISNYQGEITETRITKHYPPDTAAAFIWLKNRDPKRWRDKQEVEHTGVVGVAEMSVDEYKEARKEMLVDDDC